MSGVPVEAGPNLAGAFQHRGAPVVIGWDKPASLDFGDQTILSMIKPSTVHHHLLILSLS